MILTLMIFIGFVLDLILGDPHNLIHPVQIIGFAITWLKKKIQETAKKEKEKELTGGLILVITITAGTYLVVLAVLHIAGRIHPWFAHAVEAVMIFQILAVKSLKKESMKVYSCLQAGELVRARRELSWLVGRDTKNLSDKEITKATVETISENISDGVIAPLFFIAIGGAPLGMAYKAVNTLDSMVGYRNEEYQYLGRYSAQLDDVANYIPSRIAALLMIAGAYFLRLDGRHAYLIWKRDRHNHLSPNSAQTESVAAGALGIKLGGTHDYFGKPVEKPTIGDDRREVEHKDIWRTNRMLYVTSWFMLFAVIIGRMLVFYKF